MGVILGEKAMLVRLSIGQWSARKFDRQITREIAQQYRTEQDAGRYNKALISMEMVKAIQKAAGAARTYHYARTLPWTDEGQRILPAAMFMDYRQTMKSLEAAFWEPVKRLVYHYPGLKLEAKRRLNGMYREEDYPPADQIESKYSFQIEISPLPTSADFRVDIQGAEIEAIKSGLEARLEEAQAEAMREVWNRLHSAVEHMAERLTGTDPMTGKPKLFRDSLVRNLIELVDILPAMNMTGDPELEAMRKEVESRLVTFEPAQLREDEATRELVGEDAAEIARKMAAFMGGPGESQEPQKNGPDAAQESEVAHG